MPRVTHIKHKDKVHRLPRRVSIQVFRCIANGRRVIIMKGRSQ